MKTIKMFNGMECLIDEEDLEKILGHTWTCYRSRNTFYVFSQKRRNGVKTVIMMHRLIMNAKKGEFIDHINRNGLDNRKINLRFCTRFQNCQNAKIRKDNRTGFKGVVWNERDKTYYVQIRNNGKREFVGNYKNIIEAACAYDAKAKQYHQEFAQLNFPG